MIKPECSATTFIGAETILECASRWRLIRPWFSGHNAAHCTEYMRLRQHPSACPLAGLSFLATSITNQAADRAHRSLIQDWLSSHVVLPSCRNARLAGRLSTFGPRWSPTNSTRCALFSNCRVFGLGRLPQFRGVPAVPTLAPSPHNAGRPGNALRQYLSHGNIECLDDALDTVAGRRGPFHQQRASEHPMISHLDRRRRWTAGRPSRRRPLKSADFCPKKVLRCQILGLRPACAMLPSFSNASTVRICASARTRSVQSEVAW
jgi:hypothetical protein